MKNLLWICILISSRTFAQINLVPNWSFESYSSCPDLTNMTCFSPSLQINSVNDWFCVDSRATPNYHNKCSPTTYLNIPANGWGYQNSKTGNAYMGGVMYEYSQVSGGGYLVEYMQVKLKDSLKPNITYCVNYYVSRSDSDGCYGISGFGALFSKFPQNTISFNGNISTPPQVKNPISNIILDAKNWSLIKGSFSTTTGGEQYLTIGNFNPMPSTDTLCDYSLPVKDYQQNRATYYYFDDVSVEAVANAQAGTDQIIYSGDAVVIGGDSAVGADYLWTPNVGLNYDTIAFPIASPTITTQYILQKKQCSVITYDTVLVTVSPVGINELFINNSVSILPNPASNEVVISSTYDLKKIELVNVAGQVLLSEPAAEKQYQLQLQNFAEGIYFVKIHFTNGLNVTRKIVVNR